MLILLLILAVCAEENSFWRSFKAKGVNLGNWLILEEWMHPMLFSQNAVAGVDEWSFCKTLGSSCESTLQSHWDTWVTESDIAQLSQYGYNLLRVPVGHWALIPTTNDEPYVYSTQMQHVERIMSYANTYNMQVVLDIHGLPGSQNGKDHSGHEGLIGWFTNANQMRSLTAVSAAMNFIKTSPNSQVVAALEICNEPNITNSKQLKTYEKYIKESRKIVNRINSSMPIMFHDAFYGVEHWSKFTKSKKDNYVLDVHQYFSGFTTNTLSAVSGMCQFAQGVAKRKSVTPVFVGEFSVSVGGVYTDTSTFRRQFLETQVKQYSATKLAGSAFWNFKTMNSDGLTQNNGWSVQALINEGVITNSTWSTVDTLPCPVVK